MRRRPGFVTALVLIGLGCVFLLDNLGVVHIEPRAFLPLWPVLLILFAIEMLVSRTQSNVAYGVGVAWAIVVVLAMIGLAWSATRSSHAPVQTVMDTAGEPLRVPMDAAASASMRAQLGNGAMLVSASLDETLLVSGTLHGDGSELDVARRNVGGRTVVELASRQGEGSPFDRVGQLRNDVVWRLGLSRAVPWAFAVGLSSGRAEIDLSELNVSTIDLAFGVAEALIVLPKSADTETSIVGTVGSVTVQVPAEAQARVHIATRLNSVDVGPRFEALSIGYQTAGLNSSAAYQQVRIELGAGRIRLR